MKTEPNEPAKKTPLEKLIDYAENVLQHSTVNAHLIVVRAKELLKEEQNKKK